MTTLTYLRPFGQIVSQFAFADFVPDPANPLRFLFVDSVTLATVGSVTFYVGAGGLIRSARLEDGTGADLIRLSGLQKTPLELQTLFASVQVSGDLYGATVSLLDDNTSVVGSAGDDVLESGAGNDTVSAGAGNDLILRWGADDLTVDGGAGIDTIEFNSYEFTPRQTSYSHGVVVDLSTGLGVTQYGGVLTITGVEKVIGTLLFDRITGDDRANEIGDGVFDQGADVIDARGGNDLVHLSHRSTGATLDGGTGRDKLLFSTYAQAIGDGMGNFRPGTAILDLANPANNTGAFAGVTVTGFEVFAAEMLFAEASIFEFRGNAQAQSVTGVNEIPGSFLPAGQDRLFGFGGNDTLNGLSADDLLSGGTGDDLVLGGAGNDQVLGGDGADELRGGSGRDVLTGGLGADVLSGEGGVDRFVFKSAAESDPTAADRITDFRPDVDRIDLSALGGLTFVTGAFTGVDQVRVVTAAGVTQVQVNLDAAPGIEMLIRLDGAPVLDAGDLIL